MELHKDTLNFPSNDIWQHIQNVSQKSMSTESWCLGFIMDTSHTDWLKKKKHMFYTQLAWEECKHYDFRPDIFK